MKKLKIVKVGGRLLTSKDIRLILSERIAGLKDNVIVVHGGGVVFDYYADKLGITTEKIDGRRITGEDARDLAVMTYAGLLNKQLVASINLALEGKKNAIGLSGVDGMCICAKKRSSIPINMGCVADIKSVNSDIFIKLLNSSLVPVIAPVVADSNGELLNINADTLATSIAQEMSGSFEVELYLLTETNGVIVSEKNKDKKASLRTLGKASYQLLQHKGDIKGGMIAKLDAGFAAMEKGVNQVYIAHWQTLGFSHPFEGRITELKTC